MSIADCGATTGVVQLVVPASTLAVVHSPAPTRQSIEYPVMGKSPAFGVAHNTVAVRALRAVWVTPVTCAGAAAERAVKAPIDGTSAGM
jgi:hypothetical protein